MVGGHVSIRDIEVRNETFAGVLLTQTAITPRPGGKTAVEPQSETKRRRGGEFWFQEFARSREFEQGQRQAFG